MRFSTALTLAIFLGACSQLPLEDSAVEDRAEERPEQLNGSMLLASDLEVPWDLAELPDGQLLITERPGRIRLLTSEGELRTIAQLPQVISRGESGLTGIALHPSFAGNGWMYLQYSYAGDAGLRNRVSRFTFDGQTLTDERIILDDLPGGSIHNGGRLRFGPDGMLWVLTGDAGDGSLAQDLSSLGGKVLRMTDEGSVPDDNPFPESLVYSLGHRNPQGLDWDPRTGDLYVAEHGPSANDEINRIVPGGNYGWPLVTCTGPHELYIPPVACSGGDTWAPSGLVFVASQAGAPSLLVTGLRGQRVLRFAVTDEALTALSPLLDRRIGRMRAIAITRKGIIVGTSNRDGRGRPRRGDDRLLFLPLP